LKQLLITLLALFCATAAHGQYYFDDKESIAVYVTGNSGASVHKIVGNRLVTAIVKQGKYMAVERSDDFLSQLKKEYAYQRSGYVDPKQISELGKQYGADIVCVAQITEVQNKYDITVKLIDVETAEITGIETAQVPNKKIGHLTEAINKLAAQLLSIPYRKEHKGFQLAAEGVIAPNAQQRGGNFIMGYCFNAHLALGAGAGYYSYSEENRKGTVIPGFIDLRVNVLRTMLSPYFAIAGGVCFDRYTNTDMYINPTGAIEKNSEHQILYAYYQTSAGLHLRCSEVFALYAGAGYNNMANTVVVQAGISLTF
jgi:hypothetical protein